VSDEQPDAPRATEREHADEAEQPEQPEQPEQLERAEEPAALGPVRRLRRAVRWGTTGRAGIGWQLVVPAVFAMAGFLFMTSAEASNGFDLRPQRATGLAELVRTESRQVDELRSRAAELEDDIAALTARINDTTIDRLQTRASRLRAPAGMEPVTGPALRVTLDDAPEGQPVPPGLDANAVVVHQQDLQAVVNALWAGGARGITLQGQRLISTTGIKCVGNTVVLHGVPYSPPYRIVAVGNPVALQAALDRSEYVQTYLQYTRPPINIGWDVELLTRTTLPAYDGSLHLEFAQSPRVPTRGDVVG
jgi:uncharacterized protein YlxW (UPF0749 family)